MTEVVLDGWLIGAMFLLAAVVFTILIFVSAPYGRHVRSGWGPGINDRLGWVLMESVAPLMFFACFLVGPVNTSAAALVFLGMWELHYLHRAFIFPFSMRNGAGRMALVVIALGLLFNFLNTYLNGRYVFTFSGGYPAEWLAGPKFIVGAIVFAAGFAINRHSDWTLRNLRRPGESSYRIPHGGLFRWVSCPNYTGEILIWTGWAIATWSLAGLVFATWTAANLVPRARSHQIWYRQRFPDYPVERKALVPLLW